MNRIIQYKSACHQLQSHLGEKGINGGVEQPHA